MREAEQPIGCKAGQRPQGLPNPDQVEQQRRRLQRHDDEGGQRDGDEVREHAVEPGLVEVEQSDRQQRHLDRQAGHERSQQHAAEPPEDAFLAAGEQRVADPARVKRDDGRDGREAQLEAGAG